MRTMHLTTDGLNLRETPQFLDGNIIEALPLAHKVSVINEPLGQQYWEVETVLNNGQTRRGFVSAQYLRAPLSKPKESLISGAVREWIDFDRGNGQEYKAPHAERVGDFWQALGQNLDGHDREVPWSAAFISFIARGAGYPGFAFSDSHDKYIVQAKSGRLAENVQSPFWLFRLREHKPQLGDLVCMWRITPRSYDNLPEDFTSHTDVVVEINDRSIKTLGGNVDQSVAQKTFALQSDGFLKAENKLFAIMRNNR